MRFTYAESMCDPSHYLPLAIAAEQAGWNSFTVPDSIVYPEVSDSQYPYTPDGNREFLVHLAPHSAGLSTETLDRETEAALVSQVGREVSR